MNPTVQMVTLVAGTVIPTVVGLITSRDCSVVVSTALGAAMSVLVGIISTWSFTGQLNPVSSVIAIMFTFVSTLTMSNAIYEPTGATKKLQSLTSINIGGRV